MRIRNAFLPACLCAALLSSPCRAQDESRSLSPLFLALASTAGPIAAGVAFESSLGDVSGLLITGGLFVGPSVGQFYAGSIGNGWTGIGIRGAGAVMGVVGAFMAFEDALCGLGGDDCSDRHGDTAALLFFGGGVTYICGVVYSFMDTPLRIAGEGRTESRFGVAPALLPDSQGGLSKGVSAWMRF